MKDIIVFDYDGVIVDSLDDAIEVFNSLCGKYHMQKISDESQFTELFDNNLYEKLKQRGIKQDDIKQFINDLKIELNKHNENTKFFADIKETIAELSKKYKLIVVTSNIRSVVNEFLLSHGINQFAEVIGADVEQSKVKQLVKIKEQNPESVLYYIGDTVGDILEGKEARVVTIATTWGYHNKEKLQKFNPDFIIEKNYDLVKLFDDLEIRQRVAGIIIRDKKLLLVEPYEFDVIWTPGGKIEAGETELGALKRELKEEINADLIEAKFFKKYSGKSHYRKNGISVQYVYLAKIEGNLKPGREIKNIVWIDRKQFNSNKFTLHPNDQNYIIPDLIEKDLI